MSIALGLRGHAAAGQLERLHVEHRVLVDLVEDDLVERRPIAEAFFRGIERVRQPASAQ